MQGNKKIVHIDPVIPDVGIIQQAEGIIRSGGVVIYPTSSLYGLGVDATNPDAVGRVFSIKKRMETKPVSILINRREDLLHYVDDVPEAAREIMDQLWPGKITLVFHASGNLPESLTANTGKIGVRLPLHPVAKLFVEAVGTPLTATSVNISGEPACGSIEEVPESIIRSADMVLDAGRLLGGFGSTVVDVTVSPPRVLREGAVSSADIRAACRDLGLFDD